jgi:hypothetical protein
MEDEKEEEYKDTTKLRKIIDPKFDCRKDAPFYPN